MNRHRGLFDYVRSWPNLLEAAGKARLRKRYRADVLRYQFQLEYHLLELQTQLDAATFAPGDYRTFEIQEPKHRLISAAPYFDRVVHHAICNVIEPLFDRRFIFDSYACRKGKGQTRALKRAQRFARRFRYCLKTDFSRFFASIDHDVLLREISRAISDERLIHLISTVVEKRFPRQSGPRFFPGDDLFSHSRRRCGLPIGNQTSQLFGNVYLNRLDHFIKEALGVKGYVRYMDDLILFADSKPRLWQIHDRICQFAQQLRLRLHPRKTRVVPTANGFGFLGFHVFPYRLIPFRKTVVRFRRRLKRMQQEYESGDADLHSLRQSVFSYWGYFKIAGTPNRFRQMLNDYPFFEELKQLEKQKTADRDR